MRVEVTRSRSPGKRLRLQWTWRRSVSRRRIQWWRHAPSGRGARRRWRRGSHALQLHEELTGDVHGHDPVRADLHGAHGRDHAADGGEEPGVHVQGRGQVGSFDSFRDAPPCPAVGHFSCRFLDGVEVTGGDPSTPTQGKHPLPYTRAHVYIRGRELEGHLPLPPLPPSAPISGHRGTFWTRSESAMSVAVPNGLVFSAYTQRAMWRR